MRQARRLSWVLLLAACGTRAVLPPPDAGAAPPEPDAGAEVIDAGTPFDAGGEREDAGFDAGTTADAGHVIDLDRDGLPDALEDEYAARFLPNLSLHPQDGCPLGGIVYRVRPHPLNPALVLIFYDHLYERDCGIGSHTGDAESFTVTVNPKTDRLTAVKAISHRGTLCERVTGCGTCGGLAACDLSPSGKPRVYASRGKHGSYVQKSACTLASICPDDCAAGDQTGVPMVNAGEPDAPLVRDLTDAGFVTAAYGWTKAELFHYDPWGDVRFAGGGRVSEDLVDPAFDAAPCP